MRYAGIKENDTTNGEGICLSVFTQGCPHRCKGCFNPETWDFNGGIEVEDMDKFIKDIMLKLRENGVQRNLSILGGEPLCDANRHFVSLLVGVARETYPDIKIFLWTGYYLENVPKNAYTEFILENVDVVIDGPFIEEERDITLKLRGSKNQRILTKEKICDIINHKGE